MCRADTGERERERQRERERERERGESGGREREREYSAHDSSSFFDSKTGYARPIRQQQELDAAIIF
jgi:hypothetical protein